MKKSLLLVVAIIFPFVFTSCGDDEDEPKNSKKHEYVDLGLPSGTLWATCNVGANAPEEYGDYFSWGETTPKDCYDWSTYKWLYYDGNGGWHMKKYFSGDGKTELDPSDDAAYVNWGLEARMPSLEQIEELRNFCSWHWTTRKGVNGQLGTGPNGNTIFLPAAGYCEDEHLGGVGSNGDYWSRTLSDFCDGAYYLNFDSDGVGRGSISCTYGHTVRAVRVM